MFLEIASLFCRGNSFDNLEQDSRVSTVQIDAVSEEPHGFLLVVILKVFSKKNTKKPKHFVPKQYHRVYAPHLSACLPVCIRLSHPLRLPVYLRVCHAAKLRFEHGGLEPTTISSSLIGFDTVGSSFTRCVCV